MVDAYTEQLATFAHGISLADVPREVLEKVKLHTLDLLGAAMVGAELPWVLPVREYCLEHGGPGLSTVIGRGDQKIDAEYAALANATAGHACELDDYHDGTGHPGVVAVSASLAVAEEQATSGAEYLAAAVVGFEVISRVTEAATPSYLIDRGFHSTSIFGVVGAAASAARLLKLGRNEVTHALSIAASHACGISEYSQTGGEIKRAHAGIGTAGGLRSARLAKHGLSAPRSALEGKKGYLQAISANPKPELLTKDLGRDWALMRCRIKPYSCCGAMFHPIDAMRTILREHPLRPDDIKEIWVGVNRISAAVNSTIGSSPRDMTGAQFSLHFTLGMAVAKGANDFAAYVDAAKCDFGDPAILTVARRVRVEVDPECEAASPRWLAKVLVTLNDGRTFRAQAYGQREVPRSEVEAKFRGLAALVASPTAVEAMIESVYSVDSAGSMSDLTKLLRTNARPIS